jgi:hypothetical protein
MSGFGVDQGDRYMLLLRSRRDTPKAHDLAQILGGGLRFQPLPGYAPPEPPSKFGDLLA